MFANIELSIPPVRRNSSCNHYNISASLQWGSHPYHLIPLKWGHVTNPLVNEVNTMESKLNEITKLLKAIPNQKRSESSKPIAESIWQNKERLATVRAPPQNSVLVVRSSPTTQQNNEIQDKVQQTMVQNNILVTQSFTNKAGDTVIVCETVDDRDKLKNLVSNSDKEIVMNAPAQKRPSITIVGLKREYEKEEIIQMLVLQNGFIKGFANKNDINENMEIFAVRPLKNNPNCFQTFANVSTTLREGFNYYNNKVTIGLAICKIYDRFHIKRCNNCQHFGHYMNDCPTPEDHACGKCGADHNTYDCNSLTPKCINCVRSEAADCSHHAYRHECPSLIKQQESLKNRLYGNRLNFSSRNRPQQT